MFLNMNCSLQSQNKSLNPRCDSNKHITKESRKINISLFPQKYCSTTVFKMLCFLRQIIKLHSKTLISFTEVHSKILDTKYWIKINDPIKRNNQSNSLLSFKEDLFRPEVKASFTHNIKGRITTSTALDTSLSFSANTPTAIWSSKADLTEHAESFIKGPGFTSGNLTEKSRSNLSGILPWPLA